MAGGGTDKEYAVNTPGGQVRLADLPLEVLERLEEESGRSWMELLLRPMVTAKAARLLYVAACEHAGEPPEQLNGRRLLAADDDPNRVFEIVDEDLPTVFEEGIPKAEGEASTSTSSGAPSGSDGPRT